MRAAWANLAALVILGTCAFVLHFWSGLEKRLERRKRSVPDYGAHPAYPGHEAAGSFRALLAVPQKSHVFENTTATTSVLLKNRTGDRAAFGSANDPIIEDGIFWSQRLESDLWNGFVDEHARRWRDRAHHSQVVSLEPGCGRTSNRLATFADGHRACVRYGINLEQVQGETLSYYLANLLGICNVPPLALARLDGEQFARVRLHMDSLQWAPNSLVSLSEWVPDLSPASVPSPFRQDKIGLRPIAPVPRGTNTSDAHELMQWSDLIVFDYITGNFDRLVSNLFSLQWDVRAMERDASNLLRTPRGGLVFIDNEAGLVHGYRVLDMWEKYHSTALGSVCVFRRKTAQRLAQLHRYRDAHARLLQLYRDREPLAAELGFLSEDHSRTLQNRIDRVYEHILRCKAKYNKL
ncbi:four-jointed box protein 1 [Trichomycterus rosablanca]|uniref:four-jointed box protein 1 n=1 Tax=Trichomycterus rosablanca TaxID=2290929 RepID=UPI002F35493B